MTEDGGVLFVLLLPTEPLLSPRKPWRNMLRVLLPVCALQLLVFPASCPPPPPKGSRPLLTPFSPNARTVFMPREIRRDQMGTGRTEGDCVPGGLSKNTATAWMWGLIRAMQVPLITPPLL